MNDERCAPRVSSLRLRIVATDVDADVLARAERGCHPPSSLKELPPELTARAFAPSGPELCVKAQYRNGISFLQQGASAACGGTSVSAAAPEAPREEE